MKFLLYIYRFIYIYFFFLPIYYYTNVVIVFAVAVFLFWGNLRKYFNVSRVIGYLYTFCGNHNFIEDLYDRCSIKLWVAVESIKLTNICMYQKLLLFYFADSWVDIVFTFILIIFCWLNFFCFDLDKVQNNWKHFSLLVHVSNRVYYTSSGTVLTFLLSRK